tara:strand:- start:6180 stop:7070 length:891 start_codon:yes stop_codon:yes gene_type:complete
MKNASYYFKVRNLIGDLSDPKFVSGALSNTASEIINMISPDFYYLVSKEILTGQTDNVNNVTMVEDVNDSNKKGFRLENDKILSISVKGLDDDGTTAKYRRAKRVDSKWIDHIRDSASLLAPTSQEPVYVRKNKSIWIYGVDTPANTNDFLKIQYVEYPSLSYQDEYGTNVFPEELEPALIYGSAARVRFKELSEIDDKISTSVSTTVGGTGLSSAGAQLGNEDLEYARAYLEENNARIQTMIAQAQTHGSEVQRYAQKYQQLFGEIQKLSSSFYTSLLPYVDPKVSEKIEQPEGK